MRLFFTIVAGWLIFASAAYAGSYFFKNETPHTAKFFVTAANFFNKTKFERGEAGYATPGGFQYSSDGNGPASAIAIDTGFAIYEFNDISALGEDVRAFDVIVRLDKNSSKIYLDAQVNKGQRVRLDYDRVIDLSPPDPAKVRSLSEILRSKTLQEFNEAVGTVVDYQAGAFQKISTSFSAKIGAVPVRGMYSQDAEGLREIPHVLNFIARRSDENIHTVFKELISYGYTPWSLRIREGEERRAVYHAFLHPQFPEQERATAVALKYLLEVSQEIEKTAETEIKLIESRYYEDCINKKEVKPLGVTITVGNGDTFKIKTIAGISEPNRL